MVQASPSSSSSCRERCKARGGLRSSPKVERFHSQLSLSCWSSCCTPSHHTTPQRRISSSVRRSRYCRTNHESHVLLPSTSTVPHTYTRLIPPFWFVEQNLHWFSSPGGNVPQRSSRSIQYCAAAPHATAAMPRTLSLQRVRIERCGWKESYFRISLQLGSVLCLSLLLDLIALRFGAGVTARLRGVWCGMSRGGRLVDRPDRC